MNDLKCHHWKSFEACYTVLYSFFFLAISYPLYVFVYLEFKF